MRTKPLLGCLILMSFAVAANASAQSCTMTGELVEVTGAPDLHGTKCKNSYDLFVKDGSLTRAVRLTFKHPPRKELKGGRYQVTGARNGKALLLDDTSKSHLKPTDDRVDKSSCKLGVFPASGTSASGSLSAASLAVPFQFSSKPGAPAALFIQFGGDSSPSWGSYAPGTTPPYDQDGDPSTFSAGEIASMQEIAERVAQKFAPFNINVTTVDPGNLTDYKTLVAVVGGNGAWFGQTAGGVGYVGGFSNSAANKVFVFEDNLGNGNPKYTAEAVSHESGHGFNLQHQSSYSGTTKTAEYSQGDGQHAPVMGNSYYAPRGMWWYGTSSISSTSFQDDLDIISGAINKFGYRTDDHGNSASAADPLAVGSDGAISGGGIIEQLSDADVFSFTTAGGPAVIRADVTALSSGATLDLKLVLKDSGGATVASADTASLGETLDLSGSPLTAGTYFLTVSSHGNYGDIGEYTLSGSIVPVSASTCVTAVPMVTLSPSSQNGSPGGQLSYGVTISNRDSAACSGTSFSLALSDAAGGSGSFSPATVTVGPGGSANASLVLTVPSALGGGTYPFSVEASDALDAGHAGQAAGNYALAVVDTVAPSVPGSLRVSASGAMLKLSWSSSSDNVGVTGYQIFRGGALLATSTSASYNDKTAKKGVSYSYQVAAFDAAGNVSALSSAASGKR